MMKSTKVLTTEMSSKRDTKFQDDAGTTRRLTLSNCVYGLQCISEHIRKLMGNASGSLNSEIIIGNSCSSVRQLSKSV